MQVILKFPDPFYDEDRVNYDRFFHALQLMLNRMATSHEKYQSGLPMSDAVKSLNEMKSARYRMAMYDGILYPGLEVNLEKPLNTGNTENLLDGANMLVIEFCFPKHPKAKFRAQSSHESPGMEVLE